MKTIINNFREVFKENWEENPRGVIGDVAFIIFLFAGFFAAMWIVGIAEGTATWSGFKEAAETIGYTVALIGFIIGLIWGTHKVRKLKK